VLAQIPQPEPIADESASRRRNNDLTRFSETLQSRGQIGCIVDNRLLLRGAPRVQIANYDEAGRDAHARGELFVRTSLQAGHDLSDFQPSMHRAPCVILMRAGKTEIGQDAVAHELRDKTVVARHHARHCVLIGADDLAHVLRIEPR
jgi:hypothetical protein